jgi:trigger factor
MTLTRRRVRRLVLDALDKGHEFDVPQNLYDEEFKTIWERVKHEVEHHGRSFEAEGTTEEQAKEDYRRIANRRVRLGLVVAEIGTENQVKVEDAELQQALIAEVQRFPGQEQQVYDYYRKTPQALNALRAPLFEGKVIEFVISKSKVTDKVVTRDELSDLVAQDQELNAKENPPDHSGHEHAHDHDHDHGDDHDHPH